MNPLPKPRRRLVCCRWLRVPASTDACGGAFSLVSVTQRLYQQRERRRPLTAAGIVKVVAGKRRAPVPEHAHQPTIGEIGPCLILGSERQDESVSSCFEDELHTAEDHLALYPDVQLAPVLLELIDIEPAGSRQPQIDAAMPNEIL